MNEKLEEFRMKVVDTLVKNHLAEVYTYNDKENYSYIDLAFNGEDEVESYRIKITQLPPVFAKGDESRG